MKLAFFHFAVYVVVGAVFAEEEKRDAGFNPFLWLDDRMSEFFNPTALAKPGDECSVQTPPGIIPNIGGVLPSYSGTAQVAAACYDGIPVFGSSFDTDGNARLQGAKYLKDELACCLKVKCGPGYKGYCNLQGVGCKDYGLTPYAKSDCPGWYSQCCPTLESIDSDSSTGDDNNLAALGGDSTGSDLFGNGDVSLGNSGGDIALGTDTFLNGDPNSFDWTAPSSDSENLFLANDNPDDYGSVASLGGSEGDLFSDTG